MARINRIERLARRSGLGGGRGISHRGGFGGMGRRAGSQPTGGTLSFIVSRSTPGEGRNGPMRLFCPPIWGFVRSMPVVALAAWKKPPPSGIPEWRATLCFWLPYRGCIGPYKQKNRLELALPLLDGWGKVWLYCLTCVPEAQAGSRCWPGRISWRY